MYLEVNYQLNDEDLNIVIICFPEGTSPEMRIIIFQSKIICIPQLMIVLYSGKHIL